MTSVSKSKSTSTANAATKKSALKSPELGSAFVRVAHKISSSKSDAQIVKINGKYFKVKELG